MKFYVILGGILFSSLEDPHRLETCTTSGNVLDDFLADNINSTDENILALNSIFENFKNSSELNLSIFNYQGTCETTQGWSFISSMFFCLTVITTIGYGNKAPKSPLGKVITIPYAIGGFGLLAIFVPAAIKRVKIFAEYVANMVGLADDDDRNRNIQNFGLSNFSYQKISTPSRIVYLTLFIILYHIIPALIFSYIEDWNFIDSLYFVFITLSTIGFGDMTPNFEKLNGSWKYIYPILVCFWTLLSLFGMVYWIEVANLWISQRGERRIEGVRRLSVRKPRHMI